MMRHTIFLLNVLYISTLCSIIFGMPLDKRGNEDVAESIKEGTVEVWFYNEKWKILKSNKQKRLGSAGDSAITRKMNSALKKLMNTDVQHYNNAWEPLAEVPGTDTKVFAKVYGDAKSKCPAEDDGCFMWLATTQRSRDTIYAELLKKVDKGEPDPEDLGNGFTSVARIVPERGQRVFNFFSRKFFYYFDPVKEVVNEKKKKQELEGGEAESGKAEAEESRTAETGKKGTGRKRPASESGETESEKEERPGKIRKIGKGEHAKS
ncbi:hypothetical protein BDP27DRAFT_1399703 [Rhodocollybia butyracea]|uniref:Uncharacterized protein n=1 Tax=Rhodocollybia butyracea TaxID=206335 RepID=A0A9P5UCF5_9AGAR|nr:hypothetical protein BDP27DRAFT_1399703 [Rhodocollybia butyracea]